MRRAAARYSARGIVDSYPGSGVLKAVCRELALYIVTRIIRKYVSLDNKLYRWSTFDVDSVHKACWGGGVEISWSHW